MDIDSWPELQHDAVDYVQPAEGDGRGCPSPPLLLLLIDLTLQPHQLTQACQALDGFMNERVTKQQQGDDVVQQPVALLLYSATICAARLGGGGGGGGGVHVDVLGADVRTAVGRLDVGQHVGHLPRDAGVVQALLNSIRYGV